MFQFFQRTPFALLGAFGLLGLVQDLFQWQALIGTWIDAWQAVTRPIIDFLFGWLANLIGWEMPLWFKDYLALVLIFGGAAVRAFDDGTGSGVSRYLGLAAAGLLFGVFWPFVLVTTLGIIAVPQIRKALGDFDSSLVYIESLVWALLIIAVNYVLLYGGTSAV